MFTSKGAQFAFPPPRNLETCVDTIPNVYYSNRHVQMLRTHCSSSIPTDRVYHVDAELWKIQHMLTNIPYRMLPGKPDETRKMKCRWVFHLDELRKTHVADILLTWAEHKTNITRRLTRRDPNPTTPSTDAFVWSLPLLPRPRECDYVAENSNMPIGVPCADIATKRRTKRASPGREELKKCSKAELATVERYAFLGSMTDLHSSVISAISFRLPLLVTGLGNGQIFLWRCAGFAHPVVDAQGARNTSNGVCRAFLLLFSMYPFAFRLGDRKCLKILE